MVVPENWVKSRESQVPDTEGNCFLLWCQRTGWKAGSRRFLTQEEIVFYCCDRELGEKQGVAGSWHRRKLFFIVVPDNWLKKRESQVPDTEGNCFLLWCQRTGWKAGSRRFLTQEEIVFYSGARELGEKQGVAGSGRRRKLFFIVEPENGVKSRESQVPDTGGNCFLLLWQRTGWKAGSRRFLTQEEIVFYCDARELGKKQGVAGSWHRRKLFFFYCDARELGEKQGVAGSWHRRKLFFIAVTENWGEKQGVAGSWHRRKLFFIVVPENWVKSRESQVPDTEGNCFL